MSSRFETGFKKLQKLYPENLNFFSSYLKPVSKKETNDFDKYLKER